MTVQQIRSAYHPLEAEEHQLSVVSTQGNTVRNFKMYVTDGMQMGKNYLGNNVTDEMGWSE